MVCWYIDTLMYWFIGTLVDWFVDILVLWHIGILVHIGLICWYIDMLVHWYNNILVHQYIGKLVHRYWHWQTEALVCWCIENILLDKRVMPLVLVTILRNFSFIDFLSDVTIVTYELSWLSIVRPFPFILNFFYIMVYIWIIYNIMS